MIMFMLLVNNHNEHSNQIVVFLCLSHRIDSEKTEVTLMCDNLADELDVLKRNIVSILNITVFLWQNWSKLSMELLLRTSVWQNL